MKAARILLAVLSLSVIIMPVLELGHGLLHGFENPFHYHKIHTTRQSENHTLKQHHFPKKKFAHQMDDHPTCSGFVILLYCFFEPAIKFSCSNFGSKQLHYTRIADCFLTADFFPPFRPPMV